MNKTCDTVIYYLFIACYIENTAMINEEQPTIHSSTVEMTEMDLDITQM